MSSTAGNQPRGLNPALWAIFSVSLMAGVAMGLFTPLASAFMEERGLRDWIGYISSFYFLVLALASPFAKASVRRLGVRTTIIMGLLLAGVSGPLFPSGVTLPWMATTRALTAFGVSFYMIGAQVALGALATEEHRARATGLYSLAFALGLAVGPVFGPFLYQRSPQVAFLAGGLLLLVGAFLVARFVSAPRVEESVARTRTFSKIIVVLHGVFTYGFAESVLFSLYPAYLLHRGLDFSQMGIACALFVLGSILSTLPMAQAADRFGRSLVLALCSLVGIGAASFLVEVKSDTVLLALSLAAGGSIGPVYPITMALLGELLPADELSSGNALFTATLSLGCIAGPLATSLAMREFGDHRIFMPTVVLLALLVLHIAVRSRRAIPGLQRAATLHRGGP